MMEYVKVDFERASNLTEAKKEKPLDALAGGGNCLRRALMMSVSCGRKVIE
jgi:hypothetical protein